MLSEKMGLSESIAGATLLAFGETSRDVFTAVAESHGDLHMTYVEHFGRRNIYRKCLRQIIYLISYVTGGSLFLCGCVAATIFIVKPVSLHYTTMIRDTVFFHVMCVWVSHAFQNEEVEWHEAIGKFCCRNTLHICHAIFEQA